jgi:hypothetical protein
MPVVFGPLANSQKRTLAIDYIAKTPEGENNTYLLNMFTDLTCSTLRVWCFVSSELHVTSVLSIFVNLTSSSRWFSPGMMSILSCHIAVENIVQISIY